MNRAKHFAATAAAVALMAFPHAALPGAHEGGYSIGNVEDLEFQQMDESGLSMAVLWGDPSSGPSGFLLKVPANWQNEVHTHSASYRSIIIEGAAKHWREGESMEDAEVIGPGGWWYQPADEPHTDANVSGEEGLALIIFDGPLDFIAAE